MPLRPVLANWKFNLRLAIFIRPIDHCDDFTAFAAVFNRSPDRIVETIAARIAATVAATEIAVTTVVGAGWAMVGEAELDHDSPPIDL
jgi:hypothetical protein